MVAYSSEATCCKLYMHSMPHITCPTLPTGNGFSVAFDPLDGSSIVDTNFSVGTIFGIWPGDKLTGITGRDQVRTHVYTRGCDHL